MKRRNLILLLGGASSGAMSVGTGAFSSMEAERGVEVNVVNDERAYVGYEESDKTYPADQNDDGTLDLVTVENRFADSVTISITGVEITVNPESGEYPDISEESIEFSTDSFESGESETIKGTVQCTGSSGSATVEVTVRVKGEGVSAELFGDTKTRRFKIACQDVAEYKAATGVGINGIDFNASGNAEVLSPSGGDVDVRLYYENDGVSVTDSLPTVSVSEKIRGQTSINGNTIVGVHIDGIEGVFVHPQFDDDECDVTPNNDGDNENGVPGGEAAITEDPQNAFGDCLSDSEDD